MRVSRSRAPMGSVLTLALMLSLVVLFHSKAVTPAAVSGSTQTATTGDILGPSPYLRGHGPPIQNNYDEQIGLTFTQNLTSLAYNVSAVEQTDPTLGTGAAYLLNGLTDAGYWYQVGVSWNWSPGETPGTGFDMNYEAWDASGNSIFPANGGGLVAFSGAVNNRDTVLLSLQFTSSDTVTMMAQDVNTGAQAQVTFSAEGATVFVGLPNAVANTNGYFSGLMTEWYHGVPYYANPLETEYSNPHLTLSSGWLWMDEFNANPRSNQLIFASNTTEPVSFNPPTTLQEFSLNATTEYGDAYEFITGPAPGVTSTSTSTTSSTSVGPTSTTTTSVTTTTTITLPVTTTSTSTTTLIDTVTVPPTTITSTSTQTALTTVTQTATTTITLPVTTTTTSTSTQTVSGPTSTVTYTTTEVSSSVPTWAYAIMAVLLIAGLVVGYLVAKPRVAKP